jgi:hypothetical protein
MIGAPTFMAWRWTLTILAAWAPRQRAAEHREVLGEHVDDLAVDRAPAGDHAVAGDLLVLHAEVGAAVLDEHVELLEAVFVEEQVDALAGGQLALGVLGRDALFTAAGPGLLATTIQFLENMLHATKLPCSPSGLLNEGPPYGFEG